MANPTLVMVTDRNDLDDQLFDTFAMGRDLLRQAPVQAESREHLRQLLDRASGGVVFTTIHKFTEAHGKIQRAGEYRGDGRRGAPQPVRLRGGRRTVDARRPAERHVRRLHRYAADPARRHERGPFSATTPTSTTSASRWPTAPPCRSTTSRGSSS